MIIQIPIEYKSEFMLDMLELFSIDLDKNILTDEERLWCVHAIYFFGIVDELDSRHAQGFMKFNTTEH